MAMETAAAILTKLAFEQNTKLKSKLTAARGKEKELASVIMPLFRQILSEMERGRQTLGKLPSAIHDRSPRRVARPQSNLGRMTNVHDHDEEHIHSDENDIGGEG